MKNDFQTLERGQSKPLMPEEKCTKVSLLITLAFHVGELSRTQCRELEHEPVSYTHLRAHET